MKVSWTRKLRRRGRAAAPLTAALALPRLAGPGAAATAPAQVRVNQVGYAQQASKEAVAMLPAATGRVSFTVSSRSGHVAFRGTATRDAGRWNANYPATYVLTFGKLKKLGTYRITITAPGVRATSPAFRIGTPGALYSGLVGNAVRYFTSERDGAGVNRSVLGR